MKSVVRRSTKRKPGKQPGKSDIMEGTEQLPLSRLAAMAVIGVLILIGLMSAILAISGARPKKSVARKVDTAELKTQNIQPGAVGVRSTSATLNPPARNIGLPFFDTNARRCASRSSRSSRKPLSDASANEKASPQRKPALRRFGTESDATGRSKRQLSAGIQKSGAAPRSKKQWPKAFVRYLEAHRDYLRAILRHPEPTTPNPASRHQRSDSFLASVQGLAQPLK